MVECTICGKKKAGFDKNVSFRIYDDNSVICFDCDWDKQFSQKTFQWRISKLHAEQKNSLAVTASANQRAAGRV